MKREACDRYLRQATRGLWGKKRLEVREELAAHLGERITAHRIGGLSEAEATERALAELGAPQHVSQGMTRLYTLPTVMGSSLALIVLCLAVVALWPKSMAQPAIKGSFYWPTEACIKEQQANVFLGGCQDSYSLWLDPPGLKAELRRQGVKVDEGKTLNLTFPNGAFVQLSTAPHKMRDNDGKVIQTRAGVISFSEFWGQLLEQPGELWIEGWNNPVVHIGQVRFRIGTEGDMIWGRNIYSSVLQTLFFSELGTHLLSEDSTTYILEPSDIYNYVQTTEIEPSQAGIYGIVTLPADDMPMPYWMDPARPVDELVTFEILKSNGEEPLSAQLPENVRFVKSFEKANEENIAMFVRLSGEALSHPKGYEVVSPESVRLEPR